ncbi:hypothetical protein, partial [Mycolicibacterium stellerae]|uniref:hypothetical protein n=1 Tax=Mycolicibacterium stellerae TaxID=2358193 RepID=UPI0019CFE854
MHQRVSRLRFAGAERETTAEMWRQIHTVKTTSIDFEEVVVPKGYRFSKSVRREFFDQVCGGQSIR